MLDAMPVEEAIAAGDVPLESEDQITSASGGGSQAGSGASDAQASASDAQQEKPAKPAKGRGKRAGKASNDERPVDDALVRRVAALLFASPEPLAEQRLAKLLDGESASRVGEALEALRGWLENSKLPFELTAVAGGWQLVTAPDTAEVVARLAKVRHDEKFSPASLETLAVVAYRQPVTKAEIEAIRGVQAGPILRSLVDRGLVKVAGRAEVPGHPLLYATTKKFLETFGLMSLGDLPRDSELVSDT